MSGDAAIRAVVVDDNGFIRDGITGYFKHNAVGIDVVGDEDSFEKAIELCRREHPDVVLLDVGIDGGIKADKAVKLLLVASPHARILVMSVWNDKYTVMEMVHAGVAGYCDKEEELKVVTQGIHEVVRKSRKSPWYSPKIEKMLLGVLHRDEPQLTVLHKTIIRLVAAGRTYAEIAKQLSVGKGYVREQISEIYQLLDAYGLTAHAPVPLANWAREHGLGPDHPLAPADPYPSI